MTAATAVSPGPFAGTSDRLGAVILLLVSLVVAIQHVQLVQFFCDDSYISYRYAQNFAEGKGLVYNPGELVEGYTNFLWVVLLAAGIAAGMPVEGYSLVLGLLLLAGTLTLTFWLARRLFESWTLAAVPVVLLVCLGPLILWSTSGLETILFAAMALAAATVYERNRAHLLGLFIAGVLYALATMVRPDGVLFGAAAGVHLLVWGLLSRQDAFSRLWLRAVALAAGFFAVLGPFVGWRYSYYQDWFPNTFYVKADSAIQMYMGARYLRGFAAEYPALVALAFLGMLAALLHPWLRSLGHTLSHFFWILVSFSFYVAWAGGDYMALYRFMVPLLPFAVLFGAALLAAGCRKLAALQPQLPALRFGLLASFLAAVGFWLYQPSVADAQQPDQPVSSIDEVTAPLWRMRRNSLYWSAAGRALAKQLPAEVTLATTAAGALPFFAGHKTIDQSGLCDRHVAKVESDPWLYRPGHMKQATRSYLQQRNPEVILWHPFIRPPQQSIPTLPPTPQHVQLALRLPEIEVENGPSLYLYLWLRKDWVQRGRQAGMVEPSQTR